MPSWISSATTARKDLYPYICDCSGRTAWLALLPRSSGGVALDVGSGHGAIAEGLARSFERVYALEGCRRRCELLVERKGLKGLDRVEVIHADAFAVPLDDASVDLIACNGTLEWVALTVPGGSVWCSVASSLSCGGSSSQEGVLYIGIENSFGRQYLRGAVDHTGLRYTSLLPRPLASLVSRRARPKDFAYRGAEPGYRTYTYGARSYVRLLKGAGFASVAIFCAEPSYDLPRLAFPHSGSRVELGSFSTRSSIGLSPHSGTGCSPTTSSFSPRRPGSDRSARPRSSVFRDGLRRGRERRARGPVRIDAARKNVSPAPPCLGNRVALSPSRRPLGLRVFMATATPEEPNERREDP